MSILSIVPSAGRSLAPTVPARPVPAEHHAAVCRAREADQRRYVVAATREARALAEIHRLRAILAAHGIDPEGAPCV